MSIIRGQIRTSLRCRLFDFTSTQTKTLHCIFICKKDKYSKMLLYCLQGIT